MTNSEVLKNIRKFEILDMEQKINQAVKKVAKIEKVDFIKMNK